MARCKGCIHDSVCNRDVGHGYSVCPHYINAADVVPRAEAENYKSIAETQQKLSMERYFEIKQLKQELKEAKSEYDILADELERTRSLVDNLHDDVREAKTEVERLNTEIKILTENSISAKYPNCVLCSKGVILTKSLEEYDELLGDIASEVASEIFDEIENNYADFLFDGYRNIVVLTEKDFAELKKKYVKDCRTCKHLVSCEPNPFGSCDEYTEGEK